MKLELVEQFYHRWPRWFIGLTQLPTQSNLAFGFECGDGWFDILWKLCEDIDKLNPDENFIVHQIKEKFAGLYFYVGPTTHEILNRIEQAEAESYKTCEICGSKTDVTTNERGWMKTLCDICRQRENFYG